MAPQRSQQQRHMCRVVLRLPPISQPTDLGSEGWPTWRLRRFNVASGDLARVQLFSPAWRYLLYLSKPTVAAVSVALCCARDRINLHRASLSVPRMMSLSLIRRVQQVLTVRGSYGTSSCRSSRPLLHHQDRPACADHIRNAHIYAAGAPSAGTTAM